jgi:hypothetical protein
LRRHFAAGIGTLLLAACAAQEPRIELSPEGGPRELLVSGLKTEALDAFPTLTADQRAALFQVRVAEAPPGAPPLGGEVVRRDTLLVFVPRYPFQPGVEYAARLNPAVQGMSSPPLTMSFTLPAPPRTPVARVSAIYPSADELPENLLKFYIQFSAPMSRGEAYQRIRLLDDQGKTVEHPFLELGEELWNHEMTRFTLFFDPGRIKQGLVPRLEMGPALVAGKSYTLEIDAAWQDEEHRPLAAKSRKTFRAMPSDARQPDPARWQITAPAAGSTQSLVAVFDEPLDFGLLQRALSVLDPGGTPVAGTITVDQNEKRWAFRPQTPWLSGVHKLRVQTILEDNAGNSVGRPFEVVLNQGARPAIPENVDVPFAVPAAPR